MDRIWDHPPLETVMQGVGFEEIYSYVLNRQNTATQYIVTRLIMDLCKETVWVTGTWVTKMWW